MRGFATDPTSAPGRRRLNRTTGALAGAVLLLPLLGAAPSSGAAPAPSDDSLQRAFAAASAEYHVPQSLLLAVSYLQSRWDSHAGAPSVSGGYGPMHLTDARTALATTEHYAEGTEDPRGDSARAPLRPRAEAPPASALPARLTTLRRAAELTGLP
ncbi:N-acetylmuramoyl-L-alanine amidase, partial [Streptomyces sp. SID4985]|nr:N-acetylmuramoyl-L-alanine amidase [Streptomyces sp. SID4985]